MALTEREMEMVAIGASIGCNCIPCLERHYGKCMGLGLTKEEMQEAFLMARKVKETPGRIINETADRLNGGDFMRTLKIDRTSTCCPPEANVQIAGQTARKDCDCVPRGGN